jgi:uncharacterized protein (TIGR03663 family)
MRRMLNDRRSFTRIELLSLSSFALIIFIAALLRFYHLDLKPFHHDEGVNGFFFLDLIRHGKYRYNPDNYHGPTLYFFTLLAGWIFGLTDFALRFWSALWGLLTVIILWPLRRWMGFVGVSMAALLSALSPGLVFNSRYFIHESLFGFSSIGLVVGAWRYAESRKFKWMTLLAVSAALLTATKETAFITIIVLPLSLLCAVAWEKLRGLLIGNDTSENTNAEITSAADAKEDAKEDEKGAAELKSVWRSLDHYAAALIIFLFINIVFYSSFFTHMHGVQDAVDSVVKWTGRGTSGNEHYHKFHYYIGILLKLELPLTVSACVGAVMTLWRGSRFGLFVFAWAVGMTLGYSIIPYKTPWLMVSMLIPLAVLGGYGAKLIYEMLSSPSLRVAWLAMVLLCISPCAYLTWQQNFIHQADNENRLGYLRSFGERMKLGPWTDTQYGYVYAQTEEDFLRLERDIRAAADRLPTGRHTIIHIASPDHWPMPWYLRDYDQALFTGQIPTQKDVPIILANMAQQSAVEALTGADYDRKIYKLRPGVDLLLYVKK